jgi:hypothetical protein
VFICTTIFYKISLLCIGGGLSFSLYRCQDFSVFQVHYEWLYFIFLSTFRFKYLHCCLVFQLHLWSMLFIISIALLGGSVFESNNMCTWNMSLERRGNFHTKYIVLQQYIMEQININEGNDACASRWLWSHFCERKKWESKGCGNEKWLGEQHKGSRAM